LSGLAEALGGHLEITRAKHLMSEVANIKAGFGLEVAQ